MGKITNSKNRRTVAKPTKPTKLVKEAVIAQPSSPISLLTEEQVHIIVNGAFENLKRYDNSVAAVDVPMTISSNIITGPIVDREARNQIVDIGTETKLSVQKLNNLIRDLDTCVTINAKELYEHIDTNIEILDKHSCEMLDLYIKSANNKEQIVELVDYIKTKEIEQKQVVKRLCIVIGLISLILVGLLIK